METVQEVEKFVASLDDWTPTIPDEVVDYFLSRSGFQCSDKRIRRVISLAAERFISEVANDALQTCKQRQPAQRGPQTKRKLVMTMEDLACVLRDLGVDVRKPEFWLDPQAPKPQ
eukprot:m51a1_g14757 putative transcription initiation factor tfiid subunit 10 (115) ;mRNA; r:337248-337784